MKSEGSLTVHKNPPLDPLLSQLNPVRTHTPCFRSVLILFSHPCLGLPSGLFPSGSPTKIMNTLLSPHALHAPSISSSMIWWAWHFGEECNVWSASLCNFLHPVLTSALCGSEHSCVAVAVTNMVKSLPCATVMSSSALRLLPGVGSVTS